MLTLEELLNEHDDRIEALEATVKVLEAQVASLQMSAPKELPPARCEYRAAFSDGATRCARHVGHHGPHWSNIERFPEPKTDRIVVPADVFPPVLNTDVMEKLPEPKG